jgi:hypothetical protein
MFFRVFVSMTSEIECPVCDRIVSASSEKCPNCGTSLTMATFEDLEAVAHDIAMGKPASEKGKVASPPAPVEKSKELAAKQTPPPKEGKPSATETSPEKKAGPGQAIRDESAAEVKPAPTEKKTEEKAEDDGKKGIGRLFGRKKK